MGLADHVAESSPFQQWLAENGTEIEFDQEGEPKRMRIVTVLSNLKASSFENARTTAAEALEKWSKSRERSGGSPLRGETRIGGSCVRARESKVLPRDRPELEHSSITT